MSRGCLRLVLLSLCTLSAHAASIVVNGSFEESNLPTGTWGLFSAIPGWTLAAGPSIEIQNHVAGNPFDGDRLLELDSEANSAVFQDLDTVVGKLYVLRFAFSARPGTVDNSMNVFWDGSLVSPTINADGSALSDTQWTEYEFNVIAQTASTRLQFSGITIGQNSYGAYIDAVSVNQVSEPPSDPVSTPEPASIFMVGAAMLLLGSSKRIRATILTRR